MCIYERAILNNKFTIEYNWIDTQKSDHTNLPMNLLCALDVPSKTKKANVVTDDWTIYLVECTHSLWSPIPRLNNVTNKNKKNKIINII